MDRTHGAARNRRAGMASPAQSARAGLRKLRRLLRDSGVPLTPLVEGVRQESFDALESSLLRLLADYEQGDAAARSRVRHVVIAAKEHARFAARREEKREEKEEMALWILTWLENPPVFPEWVRLRRAAIGLIEEEA